MTRRASAGNRVREQRLKQGLRQTELAQQVGISASYLNLIEHNRRRVGGDTLHRLAGALGISADYLTEGAQEALVAGLAEIAAGPEGSGAETSRAEDLAGQFPGWSTTMIRLGQRIRRLERRVHDLSDRMASDPELADALHEVLSTVTSIRSAASILAGTQAIDPEWQSRFHRNIDEDSRRLASSSAALMRYLEGHDSSEIRTPQDEAQAFFDQEEVRLPDLDRLRTTDDQTRFLNAHAAHLSPQGQSLIRHTLAWIAEDARRLPLARLAGMIPGRTPDPYALARALDLDLPLIFRRLAMLDETVGGPVGLVICDGSGALVFRKAIAGFTIPRGSGACTLWPLFQSLAAPQVPLRLRLRQAGRMETTVLSLSAARVSPPHSLESPGLVYGHMLLLPDRLSHPADPVRGVGSDCRVCPIRGCTARREPSILAQSL